MLTELLILPTALHSRLFIFHVTDEKAKGGEENSMANYHSLQVAEVGHKLRLVWQWSPSKGNQERN